MTEPCRNFSGTNRLPFYLLWLLTTCLTVTLASGTTDADDPVAVAAQTVSTKSAYQPTWTSLRQHQTPQWLIDAKFGIYTHWGLSTVGYQKEHRGKSIEERIKLFNPDKFDPDQWAKLFRDAGARFAGPVAWHGSDYLHWKSAISDFNSANLNPHLDIVAELEKSYRKAGMKFMISYHYGQGEQWYKLACEGVDLFSPDLFWVDAGFGGTKAGHHTKVLSNSKYVGKSDRYPKAVGERFQKRFLSHYFNHGQEKGQDVAFVYKSFDIPPGIGTRDLENGMLNEIAYDSWMTDIDMSLPPDWATHGWFYNKEVPLRSSDEIVDILVDVVSKNGVLLLNVPPLADGSFSADVRQSLGEIGAWLRVNGEAIYGASPWFIFGEGPSNAPVGSYAMHHNNHFAQIKFSAQDIRFTVNGPHLYATCLGWPGEKLVIGSLNSDYHMKKGDIEQVSLLGHTGDLDWEHGAEGLMIKMPKKPDHKIHAYVFKIQHNN